MPRIDSGRGEERAAAPRSRTATCTCGALRITVAGEPMLVHACSCLTCQRSSGSAFAYSSFFPRSAIVAIEGEHRTYRRIADSGLPVDAAFCPTCGARVFVTLGAMPEAVAVPAGCFADPDFPSPQALCWASCKHHWLSLPAEVVPLETQ